ncbi:MAG TPA: exonuclease domain-containing protein [Bacteroidota bacterium]
MKNRKSALSDGALAIVDTETTGTSPLYGRVIEVAVLRVEKGRIVRTFHSLVNPERAVQPVIESITGITAAQLESAPLFGEIARELLEVLDGALFVAHNVKFDYAFLRNEFRRTQRSFTARCLDTVSLSKRLYPEFLHHDLSSLIARYSLCCEHRHRAEDDAAALWAFLQHAERTQGAKRVGETIRMLTAGTSTTHLDRGIIRSLPDSPGVYLFYGQGGELLYVGKSTNIRRRVQSHFSMGSAGGRELELFQHTHSIEARPTAGELGALLLESRLIKELQPIHNRVARVKRRLVVITRDRTDDGYATASLEYRDRIDPADIGSILTVFKHKGQAREYLNGLARDFSLCHKLLGLERTNGCCFQYHLHRCHGACIGEESPDAYNARFDEGFAERRIQAWPFRRGILILEKGEDQAHGEAFLVDQWCLLSSVRYADDGFQEVVPGSNTFDYDSYKILLRYLSDPRHRKTIKIMSPQEYASFITSLQPSET